MTTTSIDEEPLNALTHGIGFLLAAGASLLLVGAAARRGGPWQVWGCFLYSLTLLGAYGASTLSHSAQGARLRHAFRIADQALIYLFMAGSYTPVALTYLRGQNWLALNLAVWGIALAGFVSKAIFSHRVHLGAVSVGSYVSLAAIPLLAARQLAHSLPTPLCLWFLGGDACYLLGILFFSLDHRIRYFHAAWHVLVIAGTFCQYAGIYGYCCGSRQN